MSKRNVDAPRVKPEVTRIFDDLEAWLDHCRFNLLKFDPADLYKSKEWRDFAGKPRKHFRRNKG
jgi:hypothetical protein